MEVKPTGKKFDFDAWLEEGVGLEDERSGWVEGVVNRAEPFFLLLSHSTPAAILGQTETQFVVQWLCEDEEARVPVRFKLDFFLKGKGSTKVMQRMGKWRYMIYHATATSANLYGRVHLQYVEPPGTLEEAVQMWGRRSGGGETGGSE